MRARTASKKSMPYLSTLSKRHSTEFWILNHFGTAYVVTRPVSCRCTFLFMSIILSKLPEIEQSKNKEKWSITNSNEESDRNLTSKYLSSRCRTAAYISFEYLKIRHQTAAELTNTFERCLKISDNTHSGHRQVGPPFNDSVTSNCFPLKLAVNGFSS